MDSKTEPILRGDDRPHLRLFVPKPDATASPNHAWFDFGPDRHHVAVFPLDRRSEALALMPLWTVQRGPLWYLCSRTDVGGSDAVRA